MLPDRQISRLLQCETFAQRNERIKMVEISPLFVGKLVNSWLLPAFPASIGEISTIFLIAPELYKGNETFT